LSYFEKFPIIEYKHKFIFHGVCSVYYKKESKLALGFTAGVSENLKKIQQDLGEVNIRIIAVTKYVDKDKIVEAYNSGLRDFAESKAQDALNKIENLPDDIRKNSKWHFIGHLQSNKVKKVIGVFDYIHSVDSLKLAKLISENARLKGITQKILLQVNNANEETKFGFSVDEVKEVFEEIIHLDSLEVVGLMNIAPNIDNSEELHKLFRNIKELRDYLQDKYNYALPELSMGMSNDYKIAIQEGSTMIRLGQILFN